MSNKNPNTKKITIIKSKDRNSNKLHKQINSLKKQVENSKKRNSRPFFDSKNISQKDVQIQNIPGGIRVSGVSFLGTIDCNPSSILSTAYEKVVWLNPSNKDAFPKLGPWAKAYSKFSIKHSHISYENTVGEMINGTVYMYPLYDNKKTRNTTPIEAYNNGSCKTGSVTSKISFPPYKTELAALKVYDIPDVFNNLVTPDTLNQQVPCRFIIGTTGCTGQVNQILGEAGRIYHHYSIDMLQEDSDLIAEADTTTIVQFILGSIHNNGFGHGCPTIGTGQYSLSLPDKSTGENIAFYTPGTPTPINGNALATGAFRIKTTGSYVLNLMISLLSTVAAGEGFPVGSTNMQMVPMGNYGNKIVSSNYTGDVGTTQQWLGTITTYSINYLVYIAEPQDCFTWENDDWYQIYANNASMSTYWTLTPAPGTLFN